VKPFEPHSSLVDPETRHQSRLLGICLTVLLGLFTVVDASLVLTSPGYEPPWIGYGLLLATLALNRLGHYRPAAALAMAMFPLVGFGIVYTSHGPLPFLTFGYLLLGPMLGAIFLPIWGVALLTVANLCGIALAPLFLPELQGKLVQLIGPLSSNAMVGLLACLYMHHRNAVEAERRRAAEQSEERLRRAQKMEALGRLSGGVAHDFNNLLTIILGSVALLRRRQASHEIDDIAAAAESAAALTRQLLAFSRGAVLEPRVLKLSDVVREAAVMIRRLIGEDIDVRVRTEADSWLIRIDPNQLEQVLLNLATNARDAMPRGGTLEIGVENVTLDAERARLSGEARPGEYVRLRVTDTGAGMDEATRQRIFEPFFTTKERGKGTGLGLSTVFGTVSQSGGFVEAHSAPSQGARFDLYFPRAHGAPAERSATAETKLEGSETLLLVEDDDAVRKVIALILENAGYRVLTARSPAQAHELWSAHAPRIALLITDEVMPGGRGTELVAELRRARPGLRALCMTGYAESIAQGGAAPDLSMIQKPFESASLLQRVRELLDVN
jgi:signal transduction histidine kinase